MSSVNEFMLGLAVGWLLVAFILAVVSVYGSRRNTPRHERWRERR